MGFLRSFTKVEVENLPIIQIFLTWETKGNADYDMIEQVTLSEKNEVTKVSLRGTIMSLW